MTPDGSVGVWSLAAAGTVVMTTIAFHPSMLWPLRVGQAAAWLALLIAGAFAGLLFWPVASYLRTMGDGGLIRLASRAFGTPGAVATALLAAGVLTAHTGFIIRESAEMAVSAVYPHTPQTFPMVGLLLCVLYGAYGELDSLVRLCRILLPVLLAAIVLILVGILAWGQAQYLLPFWGPGPTQLVGGSATLTAMYGPLVLYLLVGFGQLRSPRRPFLAGAVAIGVSAAMLAAVKAVLVMTFPLPIGFSVTFPLHQMARLAQGGRFFERIDGLWLFLWVLATAAHLSSLINAAAIAFAEAFGLPSYKRAVLPLVTMAGTGALFPPDQGQTIMQHIRLVPFILIAAFGLPLLLTAVAAWRGRQAHG